MSVATELVIDGLKFATGVLEAAHGIQDEIDAGAVVVGDGAETQKLLALIGVSAHLMQSELANMTAAFTGRTPEDVITLVVAGQAV